MHTLCYSTLDYVASPGYKGMTHLENCCKNQDIGETYPHALYVIEAHDCYSPRWHGLHNRSAPQVLCIYWFENLVSQLEEVWRGRLQLAVGSVQNNMWDEMHELFLRSSRITESLEIKDMLARRSEAYHQLAHFLLELYFVLSTWQEPPEGIYRHHFLKDSRTLQNKV